VTFVRIQTFIPVSPLPSSEILQKLGGRNQRSVDAISNQEGIQPIIQVRVRASTDTLVQSFVFADPSVPGIIRRSYSGGRHSFRKGSNCRAVSSIHSGLLQSYFHSDQERLRLVINLRLSQMLSNREIGLFQWT
jgi:hypothetical protein